MNGFEERFENSYNLLNKEQKQAVDSIDGPVFVIAGPGTGKTTLLTLRIANILKQTDSQPENILALTFTNAGVHAMRKKLLDLIGDEAYKVHIFTFHSFAEHIIKTYSSFFEDVLFGAVVTDLEKIKIIESIISKHEKDFSHIVSKYDVYSSLRLVRDAIDTLKQEGLTPEMTLDKIKVWEKEILEDDALRYKRKTGNYNVGDLNPNKVAEVEKKIEKAKEVQKVYKHYQEVLSESGSYDFSDMVLSVLEVLRENEHLKLDLGEQYQYILVDEHQDTNDGQNALIEYLTDAEHLDGSPNVFTVGDEKQSIYRFQGASEASFKRLSDLYRNATVITLKDNYRSVEPIIKGSQSVITHTVPESIALEVNITSQNALLAYQEFSNNKIESLAVAHTIKKKISEGCDPKDIAVIYHANKHVQDIQAALRFLDIPYVTQSNDFLLEHKDVQQLIRLVRVIDSPQDNHELAQLLFASFLELDPYQIVITLQEFERERRQKNIYTLFEYLETKEHFSQFTEMIKKLMLVSKNEQFLEFLNMAMEESGYMSFLLKSNTSRDRLMRVDKLFDEVSRQMSTIRQYEIKDFLHAIDAYLKYGVQINVHNPELIDGVALLTAHRSKGLEFKHVFMIHTTRSNWEKHRKPPSITLPVSKYIGDEDDERRLFYVAMTRAKESLTISSAETDWEGRKMERSQFVSEIDEAYLTQGFYSDEESLVKELAAFVAPNKINKTVFDIQYLKDLFNERGINVTALNNFIACPIQYLFRNLIRLPSPYNANLVYGNAVHDALEYYFKKSKVNETILDKEVLIDYFEKNMRQSLLSRADYERYLQRGNEALEKYHKEYAKNWNVDIDLEMHRTVAFKPQDEEEITLTGRLDKVEYIDANTISIIDYKTGKAYSEKDPSDKKSLMRQLVFYYLLHQENEMRIDKAVLDFIEENKKGEFEQFSVSVTDAQIEELKEHIDEMVQSVRSGMFLNNGCHKCEYCELYNELNT